MLDIFSQMLSAALFASALQNLVFSGSFALGEIIKTAKKPKYLIMYGFWVSFFALGVSAVCHILTKLGIIRELSLSMSFLLYTAVLSFIYLLAAIFCKLVLRADKKFTNSLGLCAFNSLIISLPAINTYLGNGGAEAIGTAIGAGLAFVLSLLIINGGMKHIKANEHIPEFFRGTPALFIYISLIALSLSCISGGSLFL